MAEQAWLTRWLVFDAGDEVLRLIRRERTMRVGTYSTQFGPGVLLAPTAQGPRPKTWLRFEAQFDGDYSASWPTKWGATKAMQLLALELDRPEDEDFGLVIPEYGDPIGLPSAALLSDLARGAHVHARFLRVEGPNGCASWAAAGESSDFGATANKLVMALEGFEPPKLHRILGATLLNGSSKFVDDAVEEARYHLGLPTEPR